MFPKKDDKGKGKFTPTGKHGKDCDCKDCGVKKSDPFEINKARIPKIPTGLSRSQKAGRKIKATASNTFHNATSRGATNPSTDTKFGRKTPREPKSEGAGLQSFGNGLAVGSLAGGVAAYTAHGGQQREDTKVARQYYRANKVGKAFKIPKRPHLITEAGNSSRKPKMGDRPLLNPTALAAGGAVGAATGYELGAGQGKENRRRLNSTYRGQKKISKARLEQYTPNSKQRGKMRAKNAAGAGATVTGSLVGAGVGMKALTNYGNGTKQTLKSLKPSKGSLAVAGAAGAATAVMNASGKYEKKQYRVKKGSETVAKQEKASGGRLAAGGAFGGLHGAVAGKKGSKLKAVGNQVGGTALGSVGGSLAATALTRGKSPTASMLGSSVGSVGGAVAGTARAQRKGHFKVQKNGTLSAFGIDHGAE